jgi:hypothetical protein
LAHGKGIRAPLLCVIITSPLFYFILFYSFSFFPFSDPTVSWEYQMLTFHLYGENIYN